MGLAETRAESGTRDSSSPIFSLFTRHICPGPVLFGAGKGVWHCGPGREDKEGTRSPEREKIGPQMFKLGKEVESTKAQGTQKKALSGISLQVCLLFGPCTSTCLVEETKVLLFPAGFGMCMSTIWRPLGWKLGDQRRILDLYCLSHSPPAFLMSLLPLIPH